MTRLGLIRAIREALQGNGIHPGSDWGSSGRRFKSCQPDQRTRRWRAVLEESEAAFFIPAGGMYSNGYSNGSIHRPDAPERASTAARAVADTALVEKLNP
jgi:hypothetical protein